MERREAEIQTYPAMNDEIANILRQSGQHASLYAAQRIEELEAENKRLREAYALFEECSPPDVPRKTFVQWCFRAWEKEAAKAQETE